MSADEFDFQKQAQEQVRRERLARKILGVNEGDSSTEIKKAYWLLAMKYHPDKNPGDKESLRQFNNIRAAYDFLMKNDNGLAMSDDENHPFEDSVSDEYNTSNNWGYFLWWRDKYFK